MIFIIFNLIYFTHNSIGVGRHDSTLKSLLNIVILIIMKINSVPSRWLVVAGAILVQLALGALYAWSVFTKILTDPQGIYQFTA
ncbi:MAG: hypothetical protein KJO33_11450, partial [Gammaproteobacteria bacterium]|nr:hypothetical protein [Gammaproteobacteria bacterium]